MIIEYKVYRKDGDLSPIITPMEIPSYQLRGKKKFVGRKAKIEAIFRAFEVRLPEYYSTDEVNAYIANNIFRTPKWNVYRNMLKEVGEEIIPVAEKYTFQYYLIVETSVELDISDERLIYLVTRELMGDPVEEYGGLRNYIVSLRKDYR